MTREIWFLGVGGGRGAYIGIVCTYPVEIHALHGLVHTPDDRRHVAGYLAHRHSGLYTARYGVYATRQSEEVQRLALLSYSIGSVYPSTVIVALLQCLGGGSVNTGV